MAKFVLSGFILLFMILGVSFALSFQQISVVDTDSDSAVENATRNAMTQSINLGELRVTEEITIDEDIAIEAILRQYADASNFLQGERDLNIYQISTNPPMLAVEAYSIVNTPFNNLTNRLKDENKSTETIARTREVQIIEAKDLN